MRRAGIRQIALALSCIQFGCTGTSPRATQDETAVSWGTPSVVASNAGESRMLQGRRPLLIKIDPVTAGSRTLTAGVEDLPPGDSIGVHKHLTEDELVFVQRGEVEVTLGDGRSQAQAGAMVFIPRGTWIGFRVVGPDTATVLFVFNTPGFEKCLRTLSAPAGETFVRPSDSVIAAARHDCHQVRKGEQPR